MVVVEVINKQRSFVAVTNDDMTWNIPVHFI
jgi:hypothetical protein